MSSFTYQAEGEQGTETLGAKLAELLPDRVVVALVGPLGAGKTRLVQAIAAASGVDRREVSSPTFVLVHEYQGRRAIFHFDAYRIKDEDEFLALAPFEYFEAAGLSLVEWADRVSGCLPREFLEIFITPTGSDSREFTIRPHGRGFESIVANLAAWQA